MFERLLPDFLGVFLQECHRAPGKVHGPSCCRESKAKNATIRPKCIAQQYPHGRTIPKRQQDKTRNGYGQQHQK